MDSRAKFKEWLNKPIEEDAEATAWVSNDVDAIAWHAWKAGRESMREEVAERYWSDLQGDLEHGVKWVNETKAKSFHEQYPLLAEFGGWINREDLA